MSLSTRDSASDIRRGGQRFLCRSGFLGAPIAASALPMTFDGAKTPMPVPAADTTPAILKFDQLFDAFIENAVVQKLARDLHSVGAKWLHANPLLTAGQHP